MEMRDAVDKDVRPLYKQFTSAEILWMTLSGFEPSRGRIKEGDSFYKIFNEAAQRYPMVFGQFFWNPDYKYSKKLHEAIHNLDIGGVVIRDNPVDKFIQIGSHIDNPRIVEAFRNLHEDHKNCIIETRQILAEEFGVKLKNDESTG